MTEKITIDILDRFKEITKYDIGSFFQDYISFVEIDYPNIANYYQGVSDSVPKDSFNVLSGLIEEQGKAIDVIILNASSLDNYQYWALTEYVEDIGGALQTADNASKWLRSNLTKDGYKQNVSIGFTASQNQGLEQVERDSLSSNDPDGWVDTALQNQLTEEDYNLDGGYLIKVIFKNNSSIALESVVDNINESEKTYGLDIDRRIIFENDDLLTLSYNDTMLQSAKILTDLKKGDDPAFPDRGLDVKNIVGSNLAGISYPTIFRQLAGNFATDDGFKSFTITDVATEQDAIKIKFQVETRSGEVFDNEIPI